MTTQGDPNAARCAECKGEFSWEEVVSHYPNPYRFICRTCLDDLLIASNLLDSGEANSAARSDHKHPGS